MAQPLSQLAAQADQITDLNQREDCNRTILLSFILETTSEENLRIKEQIYNKLASYYCQNGLAHKIQELVINQIDNLNQFTKTRAAKIIRQMIDQVALIPNTEDLQIKMCITLIAWCEKEKKTYLKNKIQVRLAALYNTTEQFSKGIEILESIVKDVRKADDKHLLLEIYLIESKLHFGLENVSKAKASLTAARACANSIYCPPNLQAEIDLMSGILHAEEKDYKTAYSYFYEAFEAFNSLDDARALRGLKYMILTKIMSNNQDDVQQILTGKYGLKYAGRDLDAMNAINQSYKKKSLIDFTRILGEYGQEIKGDSIIKLHIESLYDILLERNLFSVIQPYSRVQITYITERMKIEELVIQNKLSELILDKKIDGTLDQGNGCLILFDTVKNDNLFKNSLDLIKNMNGVVDKLFERVKQSKA